MATRAFTWLNTHKAAPITEVLAEQCLWKLCNAGMHGKGVEDAEIVYVFKFHFTATVFPFQRWSILDAKE